MSQPQRNDDGLANVEELPFGADNASLSRWRAATTSNANPTTYSEFVADAVTRDRERGLEPIAPSIISDLSVGHKKFLRRYPKFLYTSLVALQLAIGSTVAAVIFVVQDFQRFGPNPGHVIWLALSAAVGFTLAGTIGILLWRRNERRKRDREMVKAELEKYKREMKKSRMEVEKVGEHGSRLRREYRSKSREASIRSVSRGRRSKKEGVTSTISGAGTTVLPQPSSQTQTVAASEPQPALTEGKHHEVEETRQPEVRANSQFPPRSSSVQDFDGSAIPDELLDEVEEMPQPGARANPRFPPRSSSLQNFEDFAPPDKAEEIPQPEARANPRFPPRSSSLQNFEDFRPPVPPKDTPPIPLTTNQAVSRSSSAANVWQRLDRVLGAHDGGYNTTLQDRLLRQSTMSPAAPLPQPQVAESSTSPRLNLVPAASLTAQQPTKAPSLSNQADSPRYATFYESDSYSDAGASVKRAGHGERGSEQSDENLRANLEKDSDVESIGPEHPAWGKRKERSDRVVGDWDGGPVPGEEREPRELQAARKLIREYIDARR